MAKSVLKPEISDDVRSELQELQAQRFHLIKLQNQGIVKSVDVVIDELTKKEFRIKEREVLRVHPYTITETSVMNHGKRVARWQTVCGDSRPRCSSYEALIEKLYEAYFGSGSRYSTDFSFKSIYELALDEKVRTEGSKEKTVRDYNSSYKAFISDEFGAKDIRLITPSEIKEYLQQVTKELAPTQKRFYKFKGVLNLVFDYACDPEHAILTVNPVPSKNSPYKRNFTPSLAKPEDKAFQPDELKLIRSYLWDRVHQMKYDVNGYAILFSSETGVREGEIPSLMWSDISTNSIHIHSQQNDEIRDGKKVFYYNDSTKNEKEISCGGRYLPITGEIRRILDELKAKQEDLGIETKWVFAKEDGDWITTVGYYESLYRLSKKLGLKLSNNHAFRIALNSYVYVPMGLPVTERAKLLGHSVETNLKHYTFARTDEYLDELTEKIDAFNKRSRSDAESDEVGTLGYPKIIDFEAKKKAPRTANSQGFQ